MAFNQTALPCLTQFSPLLTQVKLIRTRCSLPVSCYLVLRTEFLRQSLTVAEGESGSLGDHVLRIQGRKGRSAIEHGLMVHP